jgi:hypothetical protein
MPRNADTLDVFFGLEGENGKTPKEVASAVRAAVVAQLREGAKAVAVAKAFTGKAPETQLDLATTEVIGLLRRAMTEVSISDVLASGWNKYSAVRKYANASEYPPDKTYVEPVFKQTLTSKHRPFVELTLGGVPTGKVQFEVAVDITFEEVSLSIRGGHIVAARPGKTSASGTIKCGGKQIFTRKLGEFVLPGEIRFESGVVLDPKAAALAPQSLPLSTPTVHPV